MLVGVVSPSKQPAETFVIEIDFANDLDGGETITGQAVTSKRLSDGVDTTSTFIASPTISGTMIRARVTATGVSGERHRVQMRATTSSANVYEHEIDVPVEEI
jgi:hypothetical protein